MKIPLTPLRCLHRGMDLYGSKEGVICGEKRFTYAAFGERCEKLASALQLAGVRRGDRVGFLSFNTQFEVLWSASAMQNDYPEVLEQCFPRWKHSYRDIPEAKRSFIPTIDHNRVWPSSFWMRRVRP